MSQEKILIIWCKRL